jgi:hypothetical protein
MNNNRIMNQKKDIEQEIAEKGYESLRYSIFPSANENRGEWEVRMEYENDKYFVYITMDRASFNRKREYGNFEEAKERFFQLMDSTVQRNKRHVRDNETPEYLSPLWGK